MKKSFLCSGLMLWFSMYLQARWSEFPAIQHVTITQYLGRTMQLLSDEDIARIMTHCNMQDLELEASDVQIIKKAIFTLQTEKTKRGLEELWHSFLHHTNLDNKTVILATANLLWYLLYHKLELYLSKYPRTDSYPHGQKCLEPHA